MSKRLVVMSAALSCALVAQVQAHELAYSKAEQVRVVVPGEADSWCTPAIKMTIERPTWDNQASLEVLLGKLPFILSQECPKAQVNWKAVDAAGKVYAEGNGNASNLGIVALTEQPAEPAVTNAAPVTTEETKVALAAEAPPAVAPEPDMAGGATNLKANEAAIGAVVEPDVAAAIEPVSDVTPETPEQTRVVTGSTPKSAEEYRKMLLDTGNFLVMEDQNGCKWFTSKFETNRYDPSHFSVQSDGASCSADGYAVGPVKHASMKVPRGVFSLDPGRSFRVHASGLMFQGSTDEVVDKLEMSYLNKETSRVLFKTGEVPEHKMSTYLVFQRLHGRTTFRLFEAVPYVVAITDDDSVGYTEESILSSVEKIIANTRAVYPGRISRSVTVGNDITKFFEDRYQRDREIQVFYGELKDVSAPVSESNWQALGSQAAVRKQRRDREMFAKLSREVSIHAQMIEYAEKLEADLAESGMSESEFMATKLGYRSGLAKTLMQIDPNQVRPEVMLINVSKQQRDYSELAYPANTRLYSSEPIQTGWYLMPVAPLTNLMKYEKGYAMSAFRGYAKLSTACSQPMCAEVLTRQQVVKKHYGSRFDDDMDWDNWSIDVSRDQIALFEKLSASR